MELNHSLSTVPGLLYLPFFITCSSPHRTSKVGDILHPPGHLLLTLGADFSSHGLMFKAEIYQLFGCSSHGLNYQSLFLSNQLISVALHGSSFHPTTLYIYDLVEHILLLPKRKIPPDIIILFGFRGSHAQLQDVAAQKNRNTALLLHTTANCSKRFCKFQNLFFLIHCLY